MKLEELIKNKGFKINDIVINDEKKISIRDFIDKVLKISFGKKTLFNKNYLVFLFLR